MLPVREALLPVAGVNRLPLEPGFGRRHPFAAYTRPSAGGWDRPSRRSPCETSIDPRRRLAAENACPVTRSGVGPQGRRTVRCRRFGVRWACAGATDNSCRSPARLPHGRAPVASSGGGVSVGGLLILTAHGPKRCRAIAHLRSLPSAPFQRIPTGRCVGRGGRTRCPPGRRARSTERRPGPRRPGGRRAS